MHFPPPPFQRRTPRGAALVIVLAFVVLLTGLVVAFFSRAMSERQISNSSATLTKVELFAQGAADTIIGDLKQEIAAGSTQPFATPSPGVTIYAPKPASGAVPTTILPALAGSTGTAELKNLVKRSASGQAFFPATVNYDTTNYPAANRAAGPSTQTSTLIASANGRLISPARWNKPLLLLKAAPTDPTKLTPVGAVEAIGNAAPTWANAPDWILVGRDGTNPTAVTPSPTAPNYVVGRYAYNIYDEGGLLDLNVAGYPSPSGIPAADPVKNLPAQKSALSFADLTQIKDSSGNQVLTQAQIDQIVGWRNYASAQSNTLGSFPSYTWNVSATKNFYTSVLNNARGFLFAPSLTVAPTQTDKFFSSRQELINFLTQGVATNNATRATLQNSLQFFTHFSRDLNQPSYAPAANRPKVLPLNNGGNDSYKTPAVDDKINPSFLTVRVQSGKIFTRHDDRAAQEGEPLVKKRFALNRLAWLTYKGPSHDRNTAATGTSGPDADIASLKQNGITKEWLDLGDADRIRRCFGLNWDGTKWLYNVHNGGSGAIKILEDIASSGAAHDPDFFELLKATIHVGSLGKALLPASNGTEEPYNYNYKAEYSVDFQVLQIGANIINQYQPHNYPVQIVFNDGKGTVYSPRTIVGVANLPYLFNIIGGVLQLQPPNPLPRYGKDLSPKYPATATLVPGEPGNSGYASTDVLVSSGVGALMELPVIWNPHDPASPLTNALGLSPVKLRVVADSAVPDEGLPHSSFFVCGASEGTTVPNSAGHSKFSYAATATSPGAAAPAVTANTWYSDSSLTGNGIKHQITAANSGINLTIINGTKSAFPEPTILMRPGNIQDMNGNTITVNLSTSDGPPLMQSDAAVSSFFSGAGGGKGLPNYFANAPVMRPEQTQDPANTAYVGFYLGAFPMAWKWSATPGQAPLSAAQSGVYLSRLGGSDTPAGSRTDCYMTYRMQYKDPSGNWVTYDTKYGKVINYKVSFGVGKPSLLYSSTGLGNATSGFWATATDPRSSRFGLFWQFTETVFGGKTMGFGTPGSEGSPQWDTYDKFTGAGWLDTANGVLYTNRPDGDSGFYMGYSTLLDRNNNLIPSWPPAANAGNGWMAFVASDNKSDVGIAPGMLSQNNADVFYNSRRFYGATQGNDIHTPNYFADPDGMVRRAMGAFVPTATQSSPTQDPSILSGNRGMPSAETTVGLPLARAFDWRRGSGFYAPPSPIPSTRSYNPSAPTPQATSQAQSRPYFLHRPFYSVAELGYVFSDTPWRNLDFFTSESGSAALLDVFCINDVDNPEGLVAGKVNLNTRQTPVLQAILAGSYLDPVQPGSAADTGRLGPDVAKAVATALSTRIADTSSPISTGNGPLQNLSELVGKWVANTPINQLPVGTSPASINNATNKGVLASASKFYDGKLSYSGFSGGLWDSSSNNLNSATRKPKLTTPAVDVYSAYMNSFPATAKLNGTRETLTNIQRFREAPIRALAAAGQTRVWNLMIDVVAQTGRYPQAATALDKFLVDGEQRYWVHVSIDRLTGQVIDKQIEVVKE